MFYFDTFPIIIKSIFQSKKIGLQQTMFCEMYKTILCI